MRHNKNIGTEEREGSKDKHTFLYRQPNMVASYVFVSIAVLVYTIAAMIYVPKILSLDHNLQPSQRQLIAFKTNQHNGPSEIIETAEQAHNGVTRSIDQLLNETETDAKEDLTTSEPTKDQTANKTQNINGDSNVFGGVLRNVTIQKISVEQSNILDRVCNASYEVLIYKQAKRLQRKGFKFKSEESTLTQYDDYSYNLTWGIYGTSHVVITMAEKFRNMTTKGGSSFRTVVHGDHTYLCNIRDNFKGEYIICCPYVPPCSSIEITQMFTNFGAFLDKEPLYPSVRNIANITTCDVEHITKAIEDDMVEFNELMNHEVVCNRDPTFMSRNGRWIKVNSTYQWGLSSDCLLQFMTSQQLKSCFQDNIHMMPCFGQSHLRYTMTYFSSLLNGTFPKSKYTNWGYKKMTFQWSPESRGTASLLGEMISLTKRVRFSNTSIIIETGPWDLKHGHFKSYWSVIRNVLVPTINQIRNDKYWKNITFVWLSNIALPHSPNYFINEYHRRSDFRSAAINGLIYDLTKDLNIQVINHLMTTSPRSNDNVCGHHFICHEDFNKPTEIVGEVGKAVAQMLFHQICHQW